MDKSNEAIDTVDELQAHDIEHRLHPKLDCYKEASADYIVKSFFVLLNLNAKTVEVRVD